MGIEQFLGHGFLGLRLFTWLEDVCSELFRIASRVQADLAILNTIHPILASGHASWIASANSIAGGSCPE